MKRVYYLLTYLFGLPEEVNGDKRCKTYLYKWIIGKSRFGNLYLHHFVGEDWAIDLHDHPKHNVSLGISGQYYDENESGIKLYSSPFIRFFKAGYRHRIIASDCWTILYVTPRVKEWGFYKRGKFILWSDYVKDRSHKASCD